MRLGEYLKRNGLISKDKLAHALHRQQESAIVYNKPEMLGKVLINLKYIDTDTLAEALNKKNGHT